MTSNLGSQYLVNPDLSEQEKRDAVMNAVHTQFRPEFVNRLDELVIFHPLTRQELGKIVNPDLSEQEKRDAVMNAVHTQFRPEFVNRLDELVIFHPLTRQELGKIVNLQVKQVASRLTDRRITLDVTESAREWLAGTGYDPAYGARPLRRLVQTEVGEHLELSVHEINPKDGDTDPLDTEVKIDGHADGTDDNADANGTK